MQGSGYLALSMLESNDGGVTLTLRGPASAEGRLSAETLEALLAARAALPRGSAEELPNYPAVKARWDRAEADFAAQLWSALREAGGVGQALMDGTRSGAEKPVLLLEADSPRLAELPWELLTLHVADGKPMLNAVIARLQPNGAAPRPHGPRLRHLIYAPDPEDKDMAAIRAGLASAAAAAELPLQTLTLGAWPEPAEPTLTVLHLALHGRLEGEDLFVETAKGEWCSVLAFTEAIAEAARRAALVVLWSCHGLSQSAGLLETLAGRLIAAGACAVLAPTLELPTRWPGRWLLPFQENLARQRRLLDAVWLARDALSKDQRADERQRVRNLRLHLCAAEPWVNPSLYWLPTGWPAVEPALAELLTRARELAAQRASGFVGLEHLLGAIVGGSDLGGPLSALFLRQLEPQLQGVLRGLDPWRARAGVESLQDPRPSPRLLAWGRALPQGADAEQLWALASAEAVRMMAQGSADPGATLRTIHDLSRTQGLGGGSLGAAGLAPPTLTPPTRLEVLGGPEDGRVLSPQPGQSVGRHDEDPRFRPDLALYAETLVEDLRLSRRHLEWLGPGRVRMLRRGNALVRMGARLPLSEGVRTLMAGDLLHLGDNTWLCARP